MQTVKYGILHDGIVYGWIDKELYRLPSTKGIISYGYKKMKPCVVGNNKGYWIGRRQKSMVQLQGMTVVINYKLFLATDESLPF